MIDKHFKSFGLKIHAGSGGSSSKTVAIHIPAVESSYQIADGDRIPLQDGKYIEFVKQTVYLGQTIDYTLKTRVNIVERISKASGAMGALKRVFMRNGLTTATKGKIYTALVLSLLLYGCETWCMTSELMTELQKFHSRSLRTICGVNRHMQRTYHISTVNLQTQVGVKAIEHYYRIRAMRWLGHAARLGLETFPRFMLTAWCGNNRRQGGQPRTWGSSMNSILEAIGVKQEFKDWTFAAMDRPQWRAICSAITPDLLPIITYPPSPFPQRPQTRVYNQYYSSQHAHSPPPT